MIFFRFLKENNIYERFKYRIVKQSNIWGVPINIDEYALIRFACGASFAEKYKNKNITNNDTKRAKNIN